VNGHSRVILGWLSWTSHTRQANNSSNKSSSSNTSGGTTIKTSVNRRRSTGGLYIHDDTGAVELVILAQDGAVCSLTGNTYHYCDNCVVYHETNEMRSTTL
jgi:hypothetical protein